MKREDLLIFALLLLSTASAWASDGATFAVAGTVSEVRCSAPGELLAKAKPVRCEVEIAAEDGRSVTVVSCLEPEVVQGCGLLQPGDRALIVGSRKLEKKEATHVAWLLSHLRQAANDGEEPVAPLLWLKFDERARHEGLWIQFQEVIQDSRCPTDVVCVWQGECTVALGFWSAEGSYVGTYLGSHNLTLGSDPAEAEVRVGDYLVRLANMFPLPRTDLPPLEPEDCFVVLEIESLTD